MLELVDLVGLFFFFFFFFFCCLQLSVTYCWASRDSGAGLPEVAALQRCRPAGQRERRAEHVHERQGRRPALLRERGDRGPERRRGHRLRRPRRHDPDPDADRGDDRRGRPGAGRSSTTCTPTRRSSSGPTAATGRSSSRCSKQNKDKFPTPSDLFTIDDLGGWDKVTADFFDPENGSSRRSSRPGGCDGVSQGAVAQLRHQAPPRPACGSASGAPAQPWPGHRVPEPDRPDPARGGRLEVVRGRARRVLGRRSPRRRRSRR